MGQVIGWKLDPPDRDRMLARFLPHWPIIVADHVTLQSGDDDNLPLPRETMGELVGIADDGAGVEALVVRIGGTTDRPDGSTYHITWSLAPGRHAIESNDVLARAGWRSLPEPMPVSLRPARFDRITYSER